MTLPERDQLRVQILEAIGGERLVHRSPVHAFFRYLVANYKLVLGRAAGKLTGADYQRAACSQQSFVPRDRMLHQLRRPQIPIGDADIANAVLLEAVAAWQYSRVFHVYSILIWINEVAPSRVHAGVVFCVVDLRPGDRVRAERPSLSDTNAARGNGDVRAHGVARA